MFNSMKDPRFTHDCKTCMYLGQYREFDVYWCPNSDWSDTFGGGSAIARYSSEPSDYKSMPLSVILYADHDMGILSIVAREILRKGYVKLKIHREAIEKDRDIYDDLWKKGERC